MLSAAQILAADDRQVETVDVPEWGGSVCIRVMTAGERGKYESAMLDADGKFVRESYAEKLLVATVCDETGKTIFATKDIPSLANKSSSPVTRIYEAAAKLNRLRKIDVDDEKKDSPPTPTADSPSGSPSPSASPT